MAGAGATLAPLPSAAGAPAPGAPTHLTVDDLAHPLGLDVTDVFFAWQLGDSSRGAAQSAYRISVSTGGTTTWDSGKVHSAAQAFIPYAGPALRPDSVYQWTVQTWSTGGAAPPVDHVCTVHW